MLRTKTMRIKIKIAKILFTFTILFSCAEREYECQKNPTLINLGTQTEILYANKAFLQNIENGKIEIIIQSASEYKKYIGIDSELPEINFSEYYLVAGRYKMPVCAEVKSQTVYVECQELKYEIIIAEMACLKPTTIDYFAVIPIEFADLVITHIIKRQ